MRVVFRIVLLGIWEKSVNQYGYEIQHLVNEALTSMEAEHQKGRLVDAPVANNHFLLRWMTKKIKDKRFDRSVLPDLIRWQKMGRSKGNQAQFPQLFANIRAFYREILPGEDQPAVAVTDSQIEGFLDAMEAQQWEVSTSEPVVNQGKVQIFTEGQDSLVLCADQCTDNFEEQNLVKPMSWFVRGNHQAFISLAFEHGFLVHKVTDYKSNVKYHGEYLIFPNNLGDRLAEIPLSYRA